MNELNDSFEKLLGRQPSDAERQNLYRVRDALGIKNNDALWLILMALQYHHDLYEKYPEKIAQATEDILSDFKVVAETVATASAESAKAKLTQAVAAAAQDVAQHVAGKQKLQWLVGCITAACLAFGLFGWYMHSTGIKTGLGYGYNDAKNEEAAAAWANTPEGQVAYSFAGLGVLQKLAACSGNGWYIKNGVCFVDTYKNPDGKPYIEGWTLPANAPPKPKIETKSQSK